MIAKGMQKPETVREVFRSSKVFLMDVLLLRQSMVAEAERIWKSFWTQSLDVKPQKSWELLPSRLICREEASIRTRCEFDPDMRIKGRRAILTTVDICIFIFQSRNWMKIRKLYMSLSAPAASDFSIHYDALLLS